MRTTDYDCIFCADRAVAVWGASRPVAVCRTCGMEILPLLLADTVELPKRGVRDAAALAFEKVKEIFWQGVRARAIRRKSGED